MFGLNKKIYRISSVLLFLLVVVLTPGSVLAASKSYDSYYADNYFKRVSWGAYPTTYASRWRADERPIGGSFDGNTFTGDFIPGGYYGGWANERLTSASPPASFRQMPSWFHDQTASGVNINVNPRVWGFMSNPEIYTARDGSTWDNKPHGVYEYDWDGSSCGNSTCFSAGDTTLLRQEFTLSQFEWLHAKRIRVWARADDFVKVWLNGYSDGRMEAKNSGGLITTASHTGSGTGQYNFFFDTETLNLSSDQVRSLIYGNGYVNAIGVQGTNKAYKKDKGNPAGMAQGATIWYKVQVDFEDVYRADVRAQDQNGNPLNVNFKIDSSSHTTPAGERKTVPYTNSVLSFTTPTDYTYAGMDYYYYAMNPDETKGARDDAHGQPPPGSTTSSTLTFSTIKPNTYVDVVLKFNKIRRPFIGCLVEPESGEVPLSVKLTAIIRDISPASYTWTFGDGTPNANAGSTISHTYSQPKKASYTASVTPVPNPDNLAPAPCSVSTSVPSQGSQQEIAP